MSRKILIMGLPGAGKTTLAGELAPLINAAMVNADELRANINNLKYSRRGELAREFPVPRAPHIIATRAKAFLGYFSPSYYWRTSATGGPRVLKEEGVSSHLISTAAYQFHSFSSFPIDPLTPFFL